MLSMEQTIVQEVGVSCAQQVSAKSFAPNIASL